MNIMGLSVRTEKWRFTRWAKFDVAAGRPNFHPFDPTNTAVQYELYDHTNDVRILFLILILSDSGRQVVWSE